MTTVQLLAFMVFSGLFYVSEGKPCPEKSQPHKSRCDIYFKCVSLPSKSHVWIPEKCQQGLIYEPNLRMCVLPGDDWECDPEEFNGSNDLSDDDNIVLGAGSEVLNKSFDLKKSSDAENDSESDEIDDDGQETDYITVDSESSLVSERDFESSGDGEGSDFIMLDTLTPERKTNEQDADIAEIPTSTKVDPNLTAHLQRLTQLIDGLKQTYQNKESAIADLRPDQLNAFLAHYNIKSQLDSINPAEEQPLHKSEPSHQNKTTEIESTTAANSQLEPETKLILTNHSPSNYNNPHPSDGYSNSQIVVNKPEGSVLFTLGNQPHDSQVDHRFEPKISEDTLMTVLKLSKQMLENQDVRRVIPNSAYFPQVVQPIYLPPPIPQYANSAFNQHDNYDNKQYDKYSSTYFVPQTKPEKPGTTIINNNVHVSPSGDDDNNQLDSYGQKINSYPPFPSYQYSSEGSSEVQDHNLGNRYENNQLVTIRPSKGYNHYQPTHHSTTTFRPYISDSGSTLTDYYTPSPHLDESNVNSVFQMEKYPTLNYGSIPGRPASSPSKSHKRPDPPQKSQFYQNSYQNSYQHPNQQTILQLFPTHIDPSKVKIRPNSQKLESMEQDDNDAEEEAYHSSNNGGDDNQSETYNQYHSNKQITPGQLAHYVEQLTGSGNGNNAPSQFYLNRDTTSFQQNEDESQLGSYPGNLLSYDLFNRKLAPTPSSYDNSKPDASNCPIGVRQPNATECTRYFVCSREEGRVMQYSCPAYTAFNPQTRICDAQYYAICHPTAVISRYTIAENRRVQLEAIKALQDAKRVRDQALRAQNIALRLRLGENDRYHSSTTPLPPQQPHYSSDALSNFLQNAIDSNSLGSPSSGSADKDSSYSSSVSQRPNFYTGSSAAAMATRKRKYYCKEGDKVADQTSIYNYFVCYKNSRGVMKGHKMTCSEGLLFCPTTLVCTLPRKCS